MNKDQLRKIFLILIILSIFPAFVIACILHYYNSRFPILDKVIQHLPEKNGIVATTQFPIYPNTKKTITLTIINNAPQEQEIGTISLQLYYRGQWYSLEEPYYGESPPPANSIPVPSGEELSIEVELTKYGLPLREGRYRIAVEILPSKNYITAEFDIEKRHL